MKARRVLLQVAASAVLLLALSGCGWDLGWGQDNGAASQAALTTAASERAQVEGGRDGQDGATLYARNCSMCHGTDGRGNLGPSLARNPRIASSSFLIAKVQLGGGGMPPFAPILTAAQIADIAGHVRTSWGNDYSEAVTEEQVNLQWHGLTRDQRYGVGR